MAATLVLGLWRVAAAKPDYDLELRNAVDLPVGGKAYTNVIDASYTAALGFAATFHLSENVLLGPCVEVDGQPVHTDSAIYNSADSGVSGVKEASHIGRVRGLGGGKLTVKGDHVELWVRVQGGVDYIDGRTTTTTVTTSGGMKSSMTATRHVSSTAGAFVPQVALAFPISRAFIGLSLTTPIAFNHRVELQYASSSSDPTPKTPRGDSVDLELGIFVGARL